MDVYGKINCRDRDEMQKINVQSTELKYEDAEIRTLRESLKIHSVLKKVGNNV